MKYYKYFYWAYLLLGVLFAFDGFKKLNGGEEGAFVSFALAALAVFMFFFRRNFTKKMEERMKK
jgi:hypothetical protein